VEDCTFDGVKVQVYCQVSKANQGNFALTVAVITLELYEEWFCHAFLLQSLILLLGPWGIYGLVTYNEIALLYDDQYYAATNKQRVATIAAHDWAH
jgi:puromycin-sensitive aminopeptidase